MPACIVIILHYHDGPWPWGMEDKYDCCCCCSSFYLNSQYQTGNKPNYMEANIRMLRMRHLGGYYFKWKY